MKLRFSCECVDKYNGKTYRRGCTYDFDEDRAKEILATGRADEVKEEKPIEQPTEPKEEKTVNQKLDDGELVNLLDLKKSELVEIAKKVGVSTSGTKEQIIERLLASAEIE